MLLHLPPLHTTVFLLLHTELAFPALESMLHLHKYF